MTPRRSLVRSRSSYAPMSSERPFPWGGTGRRGQHFSSLRHISRTVASALGICQAPDQHSDNHCIARRASHTQQSIYNVQSDQPARILHGNSSAGQPTFARQHAYHPALAHGLAARLISPPRHDPRARLIRYSVRSRLSSHACLRVHSRLSPCSHLCCPRARRQRIRSCLSLQPTISPLPKCSPQPTFSPQPTCAPEPLCSPHVTPLLEIPCTEIRVVYPALRPWPPS